MASSRCLSRRIGSFTRRCGSHCATCEDHGDADLIAQTVTRGPHLYSRRACLATPRVPPLHFDFAGRHPTRSSPVPKPLNNFASWEKLREANHELTKRILRVPFYHARGLQRKQAAR
ncbi:unnamed protein product [Chondrus crispus]|uniref:Uncharacterized protein n=1 Tax=Chondrus crispus TaxID=2769 RepID=R7QP97_CHOCR|nr:unnamed protein product [Chondrus crispus]CDF39914.1 unnamed protein product [Chondrus crispus]|eukprot:XP_005710208.1 unnamed protein product [Chondrus crispus]